uniref:Uncharacterized protein MANES_16G052800 n=1 Tax=Rhizophora mucronata TaxID=61149 RepID=A0A2P2MGP2_RHIMU
MQASLDTLQSAEEVREEARAAEKRKREEYIRQVEREWAEAKKELQQERDNVRGLSSDRDRTLKNTIRQVEEMAKELANALHAVSAAETRASVAEAKLSDLEKKIKTSDFKVANIDDGGTCSSVTPIEVVTDLVMAKEEIKKLKAEAEANKDHMMQYKSIAQVNEALLKQMEVAHEKFKVESEKLKESLEVELCSLRDEIVKLEKELSLKSEEVASASAGKEEALTTTFAEITSLKEESSRKTSQILAMEIQVSVLKEDLEKEHEQWQVAKANYERQVVLQSETIKELAKTSQALTSLQQEASDLRKLTDTQKSEIVELKTKWEVDKSLLEDSKKEAEKKYDELNEQNKILHSRLEALHIHLAEKDRSSAGISSGSSPDLLGDAGLQNVVNYLRRSKEIAETEISLLKQEKMRLQSQLESALKAAETAQASIRAERANLRPLLFSEEEIKSLQLQVREMNLLRESNMQLREENKHNFEECQKSRQEAQKARMHSDSLESLVREREIEIEACKKGIEMERVEKDRLEKRISELLERCQNIDLQDYDRMKDIVHKLQEKLKEMDDEIGGNKNLLSKQQETISKLEQDLAKSESELNQREKMINDVLQNEATLKSELDKHKKLAIQWKKKADNWLKERDESSKEKQDLSKQIEELKQGKRSTGNVMGEQVIKEKEEKEHRIQILEKTVERQREALRKEKEDHRTEKAKRQNTEKAILDSVKNVDQVKTDFANKLETHKQALTRLADELEKLKHAKSILPEGTQVLQSLSGTTLDDLAAAYESAVENFEKAAHSISIELGQASSEIPIPEHSAPVARGQAAASQSTIISSVGPATSDSAARVAEEKERRTHVTKAKVETRKTGRKLVRPQLIKPEEPQGDVDMSETDGSSTVEKLATILESETQRSSTLSQPIARKREASSASEFDEQFHNHGETSSDAAPHIMKRAKVSDSPQEGTEGQTGSPSESLVSLPAVEEHSDDVGHLLQGMNEEGVPEKEEVVTTGEKVEPQKESELLETTNQREPETDKNDVEEILESLSVSVVELEEGSKGQAFEDNQQSTLEHESEREEGELLPDVAEVEEGADASNIAGSPERDALPDICTTPAASPARVDEAVAAAGMELGETNFPEVVVDEKNDEGDVVEEGAEGSDKSNDDIEPNVAGTYQVQEIASVSVGSATISVQAEPDASKQASSSTTEADEVKQVSPASSTSRVVNLTERARARAMLRQSGAEIFSSPGSRGRGRPARGRGVRGGRVGRSGRGQAPGQQG